MKTMGPLGVVGCLVSTLAIAHPLSPEAPCAEPERPPRSDTQRWNRFVDALDVYRDCIARFRDEQYAAAEAHRFAAERATERWNAFVRGNLNVPADFPHRSGSPPPDDP